MDRFIGRSRELDALNEWHSSDKFEFVVVYGRRRVGKTALLEEFIKGKNHLFVSARRVKGDANLRLLREAVNDGFDVDSGNMSLDALLGEIGKQSGERLVLVIDEFPYFAESDEGLMSALQVFIDRKAQFSKLFLVLCGSSMGFMKRQVLGAESPLYGRRTREMFLKPMDYLEAACFLDGRTAFEKACVYGAVGGVPTYLKKFSGKRDIFKTMAEEFFDDGLTLFSEPESLIMQELKDPRSYNAVIEAMASGKARLSEISDSSGIPRPDASRHLADLVDLGHVEKIEPFNEENGRRTLYFLSDNLFRFRYYIAINMRKRIAGSTPDRTAKNIEKEMPEYMGKAFEDICDQFVRRIGYPITGRWWGSASVGKAMEIDVIGAVAEGGRRIGLFGECKFTNREADMTALDSLLMSADCVKGFDVKDYAVFSKSGFTEALELRAEAENVALITLDDLYDPNFVAQMRSWRIEP
ncbi:MAG: ATP-binding protein [Candidatus Methanoplasma sp.]|jgi:AAA+ ATPase superfamily predicted ATPase|nr:ATP-binding protein [Candidatus Methanoplasma sp.]